MDKEEAVHTHSGILFSHKKEMLPLIAVWMDLEGAGGERQMPCDLACMWNVKKKQRQKHPEDLGFHQR